MTKQQFRRLGHHRICVCLRVPQSLLPRNMVLGSGWHGLCATRTFLVLARHPTPFTEGEVLSSDFCKYKFRHAFPQTSDTPLISVCSNLPGCIRNTKAQVPNKSTWTLAPLLYRAAIANYQVRALCKMHGGGDICRRTRNNTVSHRCLLQSLGLHSSVR